MTEFESGKIKAGRLRQDCPSNLDKSGEVTATNGVFRLGQDCPTTNTNTYKETNKKTKAVDLPLPAGGQASQLLKDRKADVLNQVEQLKRSFGSDGHSQEMTAVEFEQRRQQQIKALFAGRS